MPRRLLLVALLAGCGASRRPAANPAAAPDRGQAHFQSYCAACHQYDGQGVGQAPPLAGSPWVAGPDDRLIKIVLHGLRGPIEVGGKTHDLEMPGFGQILGDADLAALLSYVRARFGGAPIRAESIQRVRGATRGRTEYWTAAELTADR